LIVVSASNGLSLDPIFSWKSLVDIKVEPLLQRCVLSGELHNLLSDDTSEEGGHWGDGFIAIRNSFVEYILFNIHFVSMTVFTTGSNEIYS